MATPKEIDRLKLELNNAAGMYRKMLRDERDDVDIQYRTPEPERTRIIDRHEKAKAALSAAVRRG